MTEDVVRNLGYLALGTRLKRIGERMQADVSRYMAGAGLPVQSNLQPLLVALHRNGPLSVNELAEAMGVSQPGVTRSVGQLENAGLVDSRRLESDLRCKTVSLTEEGQKLVESASRMLWPHVRSAVAEICDGLDGPLLDQLAAIEEEMSRRPLAVRAARLQEESENV